MSRRGIEGDRAPALWVCEELVIAGVAGDISAPPTGDVTEELRAEGERGIIPAVNRGLGKANFLAEPTRALRT
jgi:hypothetical protein